MTYDDEWRKMCERQRRHMYDSWVNPMHVHIPNAAGDSSAANQAKDNFRANYDRVFGTGYKSPPRNGRDYEQAGWWFDGKFVSDEQLHAANLEPKKTMAPATAEAMQFIRDNLVFSTEEVALSWLASLGRQLIEHVKDGGTVTLKSEDGRERVLRVPRKPLAPFAEALGLKRDSGFTVAEVRSAFRKRAKLVHPDQGGDAEAFRALMHARDVALAMCGGAE